jgi:glycosyltransferase involved in cell wall biosynthesis
LNSALHQSVTDLEVILVDDASSQDIRPIVAQMQDSRLRIIRHERNRGAAAARNTGVAAARGEHIAFLDADDSWSPTKLERQLAAIENGGNDERATCCAYLLLRRDGHWELYTPPPHGDWYPHLLWGCDLSPGSTLLVRKSSFNEIGPFDEALRRLEDWDWLLRYAARFKFVSVAEPLARVRPGSPPSGPVLLAALDRFAEKNLPLAAAQGRSRRRQLLGALWLERAAVAYRQRQYWRAVAHMSRSLAIYPRRNRAFYARLLREFSIVMRLAGRLIFRRETRRPPAIDGTI